MYCCSTSMGEEGGTHVNKGTSEPQKKLPCHIVYIVYLQIGKKQWKGLPFPPMLLVLQSFNNRRIT